MNKLKFNVAKTEIMMMCAPHIKNKLSMPHIELGHTAVSVVSVAKNIGVFFDDVLSMKSNIQHICRVAYFHLHCIGRIRNPLERKIAEIIVHTYVTSRFDTGNCLLYGTSDHLLTRLQRVQNAAARLISRTKKHDHCWYLLAPIKQRIDYKLLLLTFRSGHVMVASYLTDLLIRQQPTRASRTADFHLLEVPRCRLHRYVYVNKRIQNI